MNNISFPPQNAAARTRPEAPEKLALARRSLHQIWNIRHQLPGRVRFYGPALRGDHRYAHGIRLCLSKLPGVTSVRASASSGTVLVCFDPGVQTAETLREALCHSHRSHNKWDDTLEAREVETLEALREVLAWCDCRLHTVSGGHFGLRHLALTLITGRAVFSWTVAGFTSVEAVQSAGEIFLSWILFKHPRLERELEKVEIYVSPGV